MYSTPSPPLTTLLLLLLSLPGNRSGGLWAVAYWRSGVQRRGASAATWSEASIKIRAPQAHRLRTTAPDPQSRHMHAAAAVGAWATGGVDRSPGRAWTIRSGPGHQNSEPGQHVAAHAPDKCRITFTAGTGRMDCVKTGNITLQCEYLSPGADPVHFYGVI